MSPLRFLFPVALLLALPAAAAAPLAVEARDGSVVITAGKTPVAEFVYRDPKIPRPYFANLHAPGGVRVTRNHPIQPPGDPVDHEFLHPGVWLAFADVNGEDSWRNLAGIRHERFRVPPARRGDAITFATKSTLLREDGQPLCRLEQRCSIAPHPAGYLLIWEAVFHADREPVVFGDQEEMGLGVRVATPLMEKNGGVITGSTGATTARGTWGRALEWSDYAGTVGATHAGITLMPDPANFRPSWFHNRDYGLMAANPFGRKSMKQGEPSTVVVKPAENLRLRFGVLLHASPVGKKPDLAAAYRDFVATLPK
jgi:hypothetical protein